MIADGGKREVGILKENRACSPDVGPASVLGVATFEEKMAEKKVRKMGKKIRQKRTRRRRGGFISEISPDHGDRIFRKGGKRKNRRSSRGSG